METTKKKEWLPGIKDTSYLQMQEKDYERTKVITYYE